MVISGHVNNGVIVLDGGLKLPEGLKVTVTVPGDVVENAKNDVDEQAEWAKLEKDAPSDEALLKFAARNRAPQEWYDESVERL